MTICPPLTPNAGFTLLQLLLWPWIYARVQAPGTRLCIGAMTGLACRWHVTPLGHIYLYDEPFSALHPQTGAPAHLLRAFRCIEAHMRRALAASRCALTRARRFKPIACTAHAAALCAPRLDSS
jgi:hypothetical protein